MRLSSASDVAERFIMTDGFSVEIDDMGAELSPDFGGGERPDVPKYRILLIGDFAGSEFAQLPGELAGATVDVTADTFDAVMSANGPRVGLNLNDPQDAKVSTTLDMRFDSLKALDAEAVAARIPAAKPLLAAREAVSGRLGGKSTHGDLKSEIDRLINEAVSLAWLSRAIDAPIATSGAASTPPPAGAVDDLLGSIDLGESGSNAPKRSAISSLVASAAGGGLSAAESTALRSALAEIDRRLDAWLAAAMHSPAFMAAESAWRSAAFLVRNIEFRKGITLTLLHARRAEVLDRLKSLVIDPVFEQGAAAPDLIAFDYALGSGAADIETLDEITQHAASIPAVALIGAGPAYFGAKFAWQIPTLPPLHGVMDQWQFAKLKTLRDQLYARSTAVVFGQGLLRRPSRRSRDSAAEYQFNEPAAGAHELIWANGVVAAAAVVARSVAGTGWPTAVTGIANGRVPGFTTIDEDGPGQKAFGPTDTLMQLPKIQELGAVGVNAVVGVKGEAEAVLWNGITLAKPTRWEEGGILEISLPYQLFATRLAGLLLGAKDGWAGLPGDKVADTIKTQIYNWLGLHEQAYPGGVVVQTRAPEGDAAGLEFAATVIPPPTILPGSVPVVLGFRIR